MSLVKKTRFRASEAQIYQGTTTHVRTKEQTQGRDLCALPALGHPDLVSLGLVCLYLRAHAPCAEKTSYEHRRSESIAGVSTPSQNPSHNLAAAATETYHHDLKQKEATLFGT